MFLYLCFHMESLMAFTVFCLSGTCQSSLTNFQILFFAYGLQKFSLGWGCNLVAVNCLPDMHRALVQSPVQPQTSIISLIPICPPVDSFRTVTSGACSATSQCRFVYIVALEIFSVIIFLVDFDLYPCLASTRPKMTNVTICFLFVVQIGWFPLLCVSVYSSWP